MSDLRELFERQAAWQAGRRRLSWAEKVRMAEAMRETLARFRAAPHAAEKPGTTGGPKTPPNRAKP